MMLTETKGLTLDKKKVTPELRAFLEEKIKKSDI